MDDEPKEMGLTNFEYAFYVAIANNDSAKELMEKDVRRELAVVLTERVRSSASIDWTIKESVRSKLKVIVKLTLRQFGYPQPKVLFPMKIVCSSFYIWVSRMLLKKDYAYLELVANYFTVSNIV